MFANQYSSDSIEQNTSALHITNIYGCRFPKFFCCKPFSLIWTYLENNTPKTCVNRLPGIAITVLIKNKTNKKSHRDCITHLVSLSEISMHCTNNICQITFKMYLPYIPILQIWLPGSNSIYNYNLYFLLQCYMSN